MGDFAWVLPFFNTFSDILANMKPAEFLHPNSNQGLHILRTTDVADKNRGLNHYYRLSSHNKATNFLGEPESNMVQALFLSL